MFKRRSADNRNGEVWPPAGRLPAPHLRIGRFATDHEDYLSSRASGPLYAAGSGLLIRPIGKLGDCRLARLLPFFLFEFCRGWNWTYPLFFPLMFNCRSADNRSGEVWPRPGRIAAPHLIYRRTGLLS